jgi:hypothetical protein
VIRFLAEVSLRTEEAISPVPSNDVSRNYDVYQLTMAPPLASSYWTDWEGSYDVYVGTQIELYYGRFLDHVPNIDEVKARPFTLFIDDDDDRTVYINLPIHPWLYPGYAAEGENVVPFLSSALDPGNPSRNSVRSVNAGVRLEAPNFTVKLSENISGITLNQGFSLNFHNNDGYFDDDTKWDLFNTPVHVRKAVAENPSYEDFREIRGGYAESTRTTFDGFSITVSDKLRSLSDPVCGIIRQEDFAPLTLSEDARGKSIPVIYGQKKIKLIKLDDSNHYFAAEYSSAVNAVYDKDGNTLPDTFDPSTRIISFDYSAVTGVYNKDGNNVQFTYTDGILRTVMSGGKYPDIDYITDSSGYRIPYKYDKGTGIITYAAADSAIVTGYTENRIGEILKDLITRKTSVAFTSSNWNLEELDIYTGISPPVNIVFSSGDVKTAVQDTVKSDMAYFIQQADGRFTIRKWGELYSLHELDTWQITKEPEKDYDYAQDNYFSSCTVKYNKTDNDVFDTLFFDEMENAAEDQYRKRHFKEYDTDLVNPGDALSLARLLGDRFTVMRQRIQIAAGADTSGMELMDSVIFGDVHDPFMINGREFSKENMFVIVGINPAQDILTLESESLRVFDNMEPGFNNDDYEEVYDNMYADTGNGEYDFIVDEGVI